MKTDRRTRRGQHYSTRRTDVTSTRQPRPAPRRQGTRHGAISAHLREI